MRLFLEVDDGSPPFEPPGGAPSLVSFMSFAVARGFGAQHPFIALADRLHGDLRVSLGPLTTFYEAAIEDDEDRDKLELAWQAAEPLACSLRGLVHALANDAASATFARRAGAPALAAEAEALLPTLDRAAAGCHRIRLSYAL
jgi:hypothetical protein